MWGDRDRMRITPTQYGHVLILHRKSQSATLSSAFSPLVALCSCVFVSGSCFALSVALATSVLVVISPSLSSGSSVIAELFSTWRITSGSAKLMLDPRCLIGCCGSVVCNEAVDDAAISEVGSAFDSTVESPVSDAFAEEASVVPETGGKRAELSTFLGLSAAESGDRAAAFSLAIFTSPAFFAASKPIERIARLTGAAVLLVSVPEASVFEEGLGEAVSVDFADTDGVDGGFEGVLDADGAAEGVGVAGTADDISLT